MTAHGTTDRDLAALTYLAGRLRVETYGCGPWDQRGLEVKVAEFKNQNLTIVVEQILRHATDPEAKTPGALHRKFSPPMPSEREPRKRGNPRAGDEGECSVHLGQWADNCAGCRTNSLVGDDDDTAPPSPGECHFCLRGRECPIHREEPNA
jgi:hypothetical protein